MKLLNTLRSLLLFWVVMGIVVYKLRSHRDTLRQDYQALVDRRSFLTNLQFPVHKLPPVLDSKVVQVPLMSDIQLTIYLYQEVNVLRNMLDQEKKLKPQSVLTFLTYLFVIPVVIFSLFFRVYTPGLGETTEYLVLEEEPNKKKTQVKPKSSRKSVFLIRRLHLKSVEEAIEAASEQTKTAVSFWVPLPRRLPPIEKAASKKEVPLTRRVPFETIESKETKSGVSFFIPLSKEEVAQKEPKMSMSSVRNIVCETEDKAKTSASISVPKKEKETRSAVSFWVPLKKSKKAVFLIRRVYAETETKETKNAVSFWVPLPRKSPPKEEQISLTRRAPVEAKKTASKKTKNGVSYWIPFPRKISDEASEDPKKVVSLTRRAPVETIITLSKETKNGISFWVPLPRKISGEDPKKEVSLTRRAPVETADTASRETKDGVSFWVPLPKKCPPEEKVVYMTRRLPYKTAAFWVPLP